MTKAERIRVIAKAYPELSTVEIGKRVGCGDSYVRVVLRQRVGGFTSAIDRRWREKNADRVREINAKSQRRRYWRLKDQREASHA